MRKLTVAENNAIVELGYELTDGLDANKYDKQLIKGAVRAGFVAGLEYQQARIDRLLAYIQGQIPMSDIEKELESAAGNEAGG